LSIKCGLRWTANEHAPGFRWYIESFGATTPAVAGPLPSELVVAADPLPSDDVVIKPLPRINGSEAKRPATPRHGATVTVPFFTHTELRQTKTFTATYSDANGAADLKRGYLLAAARRSA